jgi:hypothetical protein
LTPTLKGALEGKRSRLTTYCHLWHLCGGRPGPITVTAKDIGAALNIDERTARGDLDGLREVALVDFHDRDRETGVYSLYVCAPEAPGQVRRVEVEPQAELFVEPTTETDPQTPKIVAGVFAQKPPQAENDAGLLAQKPPRSGQRSLWDSENSSIAETPAGLLAQKPTMDHETIEDGTIGSAALKEFNSPLTVSPAETKRAADATSSGGDRTLAAMADREAMEKLKTLMARRVAVPPANDPAEASARNKALIVKRLVDWADEFVPHGCKPMDPARAGQIADHFRIDGAQLGLTETDLFNWLDEIRTWFLAGKKIKGKLIENPAGVLDARLEKVLAENGVPTRAKSKRRRQ